MIQPSLFASDRRGPASKPHSDDPVRMTVLITVKTGPNPTRKYGYSGCVAGLRLDPPPEDWVRLFPWQFDISHRTIPFDKYEIVQVDAVPARQDDSRLESWRPNRETVKRLTKPLPKATRCQYLEPHIETSMCAINAAAKSDRDSRSLALIRPRELLSLDLKPHPGWTPRQQAIIDSYANQVPLIGETPARLPAARFQAKYRYLCHHGNCREHRQLLLDSEFTDTQHAGDIDDRSLRSGLRDKFLKGATSTDFALYVGNTARHPQSFSVLGRYLP